MPRALLGPVMAMARPCRPSAEAKAVRAAAGRRNARSAHAVAADIARRVVADVIAYLDLDLSDPMIAVLAEIEAQAKPTPIATLSRCPYIDTAAEVLELRAIRFRARGCRQITDLAWQRETAEIAAIVEAKLTQRYARHLRK